MTRADIELLHAQAVYPGHPVTLAYLIVQLYPSLDAARAMGKHFAAVEEDGRLPGAGSHNTYAVEFLCAVLERDVPWERAVAERAVVWARIDNQAQRDRDRWARGQSQADQIAPKLKALLDGGWR